MCDKMSSHTKNDAKGEGGRDQEWESQMSLKRVVEVGDKAFQPRQKQERYWGLVRRKCSPSKRRSLRRNHDKQSP